MNLQAETCSYPQTYFVGTSAETSVCGFSAGGDDYTLSGMTAARVNAVEGNSNRGEWSMLGRIFDINSGIGVLGTGKTWGLNVLILLAGLLVVSKLCGGRFNVKDRATTEICETTPLKA